MSELYCYLCLCSSLPFTKGLCWRMSINDSIDGYLEIFLLPCPIFKWDTLVPGIQDGCNRILGNVSSTSINPFLEFDFELARDTKKINKSNLYYIIKTVLNSLSTSKLSKKYTNPKSKDSLRKEQYDLK